MKRRTNSKKSSKKAKTKKAAARAAKKEAQPVANAQLRWIVESANIEDVFLDCAIQQLVGVNILEYNELEGFPFKFGRVHVTEILTGMLMPDAQDQDRNRLLCIVILLGRIAYHVNSSMLRRIIGLRNDMIRLYSSAADASTAANASRLAGELEECHDLLLAELEFLGADARNAALQASMFSFASTKGDENKSIKEEIADLRVVIKAYADAAIVKEDDKSMKIAQDTNARVKNIEAVAVYNESPSAGQKARHSKKWQIDRGVELYMDGNKEGRTYSYDQAAMTAIDESKNKPGGYQDTERGRAALAKAIAREVKKRHPNLRQ